MNRTIIDLAPVPRWFDDIWRGWSPSCYLAIIEAHVGRVHDAARCATCQAEAARVAQLKEACMWTRPMREPRGLLISDAGLETP